MEMEFLTKSDLKSFEAKLNRIQEDLKLLNEKSGIGLKSKWLDNEDLLKLTHGCKRTLQRWRDTGVIPFSKVGRKIYYRAEDVNELLSSNLTGGWQFDQLKKQKS